ncbi:MAG: hypothetical protein KW806_02955 [Candidatus Yanofskybacteria bacterium]|nr:hypothetical protein [Candidatus Yanofskybacteria bacterium]
MTHEEALKNGGPAFPMVFPNEDPNKSFAFHGMNLLDWFAGQALMGILTNQVDDNPYTYDEAASKAYNYARAMLAEKLK